MFRVLLVQPPFPEDTTYYEPPLHLAYLAASLMRRDIDVSIADVQLSGWLHLRELLSSGYDLVGTTVYTYSLRATRRIVDLAKSINPHVPVILGGAHPTFAHQDCFDRFEHIDGIMQGESENALTELCSHLTNGSLLHTAPNRIPNLLLRDSRSPDQSRTWSFAAIDRIPPASEAFSLLNLRAAVRRNKFVPIIASRGCPYSCTYCTSPRTWNGIRIRALDSLRNELERYLRAGISHLNFRDDCFSMLRNLLPNLLTYLKRAEVRWECETRIDDLSPQRAEQFVNAGLVGIRVSMETIHEKSLRQLNRRQRPCDVCARVKTLVQHCPNTRVSFMIGIPGETVSDVKKTLDFAEKLRPAICKFWAYSPLPGSPIFDDPSRHGITHILPFDELKPNESFIETTTMTNEQINDLLCEARTRFHDPVWSDTGRQNHAGCTDVAQ